jgi:hypothetical protein
MLFNRSLGVLIFASLLCGAGLFFLGAALSPSGSFWSSAPGGGYIVLITEDSVSDREIQGRLTGQGVGGVISESSQWALLDDFGTLEKIPLDGYFNRILPFDPRNDGYAEKLRAFFVHDGKRFFFIPRGAALPSAWPGNIEKRLFRAMENTGYSVEYLGAGGPAGFFFLLFGLASCGLPLVRLRRPRPPLAPGYAASCLPVLAPLVLCSAGNAAGFVLAALLLGLGGLLLEPLQEWFTLFHYRWNVAGARRFFFRDVFEPFRSRWLLSPLFPAGYALVVYFSGFSPALAAAVFFVYAGVCCFAARTFLSRDVSRGHLRFSPVPILRRRPFSFAFSWTMLPFALAAIIAAFASPFFARSPPPAAAAFAGVPIVTEAEYRAHAVFQAAFSQQPLGRSPAPTGRDDYALYTLDADGLVSPAPSSPAAAIPRDIPPFPLKRLMFFFARAALPADADYSPGGKAGPMPR